MEGAPRSPDRTPTFLGWQGDARSATDPRIAAREFQAALERFAARHGVPATVVWVPLNSLITTYPGVTVEPRRTIRPGDVWPGAVLPAGAAGADDAPDRTAPPGPDDRPIREEV